MSRLPVFFVAFVEFYPPADIDGLSALTASRLLVDIGTIVRQA